MKRKQIDYKDFDEKSIALTIDSKDEQHVLAILTRKEREILLKPGAQGLPYMKDSIVLVAKMLGLPGAQNISTSIDTDYSPVIYNIHNKHYMTPYLYEDGRAMWKRAYVVTFLKLYED